MRDGVVHLVDDDSAVRDSVAFLLESADYRVTAYADPHAVLDALRSGARMSCLVTDVRMPEMDGLQLVRAVRAIDPDLPIIVITGHGDVPLAVEAMKIGASDFLEKPFDDEHLIRALRQALAAGPRDVDEHADIRRRLDGLSSREREVLQGLADGHPNKVIAWRLNISPRTVEVYRAKAMSKMGAGSFAELVQMAILADLRFAPSLVPRDPAD